MKIDMFNMVTQKNETKTDSRLIELINSEINNWIEYTKKDVHSIDFANLSEIVVIFGIGYESYNTDSNKPKEIQYVAGIGTNLYSAITHAQSGFDDDYKDDIIIKMNVDFIPYKIQIGYSVKITE